MSLLVSFAISWISFMAFKSLVAADHLTWAWLLAGGTAVLTAWLCGVVRWDHREY